MLSAPLCLRRSLAAALGAISLGALLGCAHSARRPIWSDEFHQAVGSAPDATKWVHELGAGGWGNNELQRYTADSANVRIVADPAASDGRALCLTAIRDDAGAYTSARLKTEGRFAVRHGRIEARLRTSDGQGVWPAFWMLGTNIRTIGWPDCGEIDILEALGHLPTTVHGTLHGPGYSGAAGLQGRHTLADRTTMSSAYHVYAVDWTPDHITWSVDGITYHTLTAADLPPGARWVFNDSSFYLLLNLAIGGNWPGYPDATTPFPRTLHIDYVRVYAPTASVP